MKKIFGLLFLFSIFALQGSKNNQNNPQVALINLGSLAADADVKQTQTLLVVHDVAASLDGKYFLLADENGTVAFWIDVDNDGAAEPAGAIAADRAVEITTIATGDTANDVGDKVAAAIDADGAFIAPNPAAATITITNYTAGHFTGMANGDSGFTTTAGVTGAEGSVLRPAINLPMKSRIVGAYLINGGDIAASNTEYLSVSLKNGANIVASMDTRSAYEGAVATDVAKALSLMSVYSLISAGSTLTIDYNETEGTGTVGLTNAKLAILWYPL